MSILNIVVFVLLGVIALILLVAAFVKKSYAVSRQITVAAPNERVFDYIKYIRNQDRFSVWANMDPEMKKEYTGTDGQPGFLSAWESENKRVGKGEQRIVSVEPDREIKMSIHFITPWEGLADASLSTRPVAEAETEVTWAFSSRMKYPMNIMLLVLNMDKMLGADLETGLANLKAELEGTTTAS